MKTSPLIRILCVLSFGAAIAAAQTPAAPAPSAQPELTNGRRILEKSDAALKSITAATYDVEAFAGPMQAPDMVKFAGNGSVADKVERGLPRFRVKGSMTTKGRDAAGNPVPGKNLEIAYDRKEFSAINESERMYGTSRNPMDFGPIVDMTAIAIAHEFCNPQPFKAELEGSVDLEGSEAVGGVDCYVLKVVYPQGSVLTRFWIGKGDFLPRKMVREADQGPNGRVVGTTTLTNLQVNPTLAEDAFRVKRPDGYGDFPTPQPVVTSQSVVGKEDPRK